MTNKKDTIEMAGKVLETLPNVKFIVELENLHLGLNTLYVEAWDNLNNKVLLLKKMMMVLISIKAHIFKILRLSIQLDNYTKPTN